MKFTASWHQPGCLPDTTEPLPTFDTLYEAVHYLAGEVDRFWDEDYTGVDGLPDEEREKARDTVDGKWLPVHTALNTGPATGEASWSATTGDGSLVFSIDQVTG